MSNKMQTLLDVFKSSSKVFYDRPEGLTPAQIKTEIDQREATLNAVIKKRTARIKDMFAPFNANASKAAASQSKTLNPFL